MTTTATQRALLIDGEWVETGDWIEVRSPYSGEVVGRVAKAGAGETSRAIDAAERAMREPLPGYGSIFIGNSESVEPTTSMIARPTTAIRTSGPRTIPTRAPEPARTRVSSVIGAVGAGPFISYEMSM